MNALYEKRYTDRNGKQRVLASVAVNEKAPAWFKTLMGEIAEDIERRIESESEPRFLAAMDAEIAAKQREKS